MFIKNSLKLSVASLALALSISAASAETTKTYTYVEAQNFENVNQIDFTIFDTNNDGIYSMAEVGGRLFESFDRDDNGLIDNIEWDKKVVMTITPMQQETYKFIDYDDDGMTEKSVYTYQEFYQASGLIGFDDNQDGLSASDFIETPMLELDKDDNKMISLAEWDDAYIEAHMKHNQPENYN